MMFRSFLRNPRVTKKNKVWEYMTTDEARANVAGPLRLYHIKEQAANIQKRFAIMSYEKTYDTEQSFVVLFDEKGGYIGYYTFSSIMFYEDYSNKVSCKELVPVSTLLQCLKLSSNRQVSAVLIGISTRNDMTI